MDLVFLLQYFVRQMEFAGRKTCPQSQGIDPALIQNGFAYGRWTSYVRHWHALTSCHLPYYCYDIILYNVLYIHFQDTIAGETRSNLRSAVIDCPILATATGTRCTPMEQWSNGAKLRMSCKTIEPIKRLRCYSSGYCIRISTSR